MLSGAKSVVQDRLLVNKVTSTTNQPVGGPQLEEIKAACDESDARCKGLVELLIQRLAKDNPVIKLKCMRIIEYVSTSGKPIFSVEMMKHMNELKAASTFTGAPDPLRGMEPYKALHDQAKNTIEQVAARVNGGSRKPQNGLFNQIPRAGAGGVPVAKGAHIGPPKTTTTTTGPTPGGGGVAPRMTGVGGGTAQQPQTGNNWQNKASQLGKTPQLNNFIPRGQVQPPNTGVNDRGTSVSNTNYIPKVVGPRGQVQPRGPAQPDNNYRPPQGNFQISRTVNSGKANTDGTYERGLVNELCAPGGMKPVPPADKLEIFVRNCRNIPADIIAPLLLAKLSEDSYQVQLKALCVVEALCKQEGCEDYLEYFKENQEEIAELGIKGNKAVAKKADSVIVLIERGGEDEPEEEEEPEAPPPPRRTPQQQQQQQAPPPEEEVEADLMAMDIGGDTSGGGGMDENGGDLFNILPTESEAPPAAGVPEVNEDNLFEGMNTEVVNKSVVDNFDFTTIPPTNVPTASSGGGDMFGDLNFNNPTSMTMNSMSTTSSTTSHNIMSSDSSGGGADAFAYFENVKPARGRSRGSSAGIDMNAIPSYNPQQQQHAMQYNMPPPGGMNYNMPPQPGMNYNMPPGGVGGYNMPPPPQQQPGMNYPPNMAYNMPPQPGMNYNMPPGGGYNMPPPGGMNYNMQPGGGYMQPGMAMQVPPPQQQKPKQPDQFANLLPDF